MANDSTIATVVFLGIGIGVLLILILIPTSFSDVEYYEVRLIQNNLSLPVRSNLISKQISLVPKRREKQYKTNQLEICSVSNISNYFSTAY